MSQESAGRHDMAVAAAGGGPLAAAAGAAPAYASAPAAPPRGTR